MYVLKVYVLQSNTKFWKDFEVVRGGEVAEWLPWLQHSFVMFKAWVLFPTLNKSSLKPYSLKLVLSVFLFRHHAHVGAILMY